MFDSDPIWTRFVIHLEKSISSDRKFESQFMVSRAVLISVAAVIGLLVGFGASYVVSAGRISSLQSSLSQATESNSMLLGEIHNETLGLAFKTQSGQMIHSGWVFISPIGSGDYAVSLHAEGLEPPSMGGYIVEGVTRGGAMNMVPIAGNATASEFDSGTDGVGTYWTTLMQNPSTTYEAIDLLYLPGMNMTQAAVVGTVQLP